MIAPKLSSVFSNIISDKKHSFCYAKSTITNLLVYYTDLVSIVSRGIRVDAVYMDIRKAFNSVNVYFVKKIISTNLFN